MKYNNKPLMLYIGCYHHVFNFSLEFLYRKYFVTTFVKKIIIFSRFRCQTFSKINDNGWTRTLFREMVKFSSFQKISMPSDSAFDITPMLKFWVACMLSVHRYRRKRGTDIGDLVYGETPSKSKIFQNWKFLRILHGIWLDGVFFLSIILIHTRIMSVPRLLVREISISGTIERFQSENI